VKAYRRNEYGRGVWLLVALLSGLMSVRADARAPQPGARAIEHRRLPLDRAATMVWDANHVPHIFAASLRDAYCLLGWVHARDRMWQMEMQRRTGAGRLAEVLGARWLESDIQMRVLGLYRDAQQDYASLDAATRADLDAYARCVNAYLADRGSHLSGEFSALHLTPEPWRPEDSLVWLRLIGLQLSGNSYEEVLRARLHPVLAPAVYDALFPGGERDSPAVAAVTERPQIDWARFAASLPLPLGPSRASDEWVVDGRLTRSGKPLLANDPHLSLQAPIMWYLASVVTPEGSLSGATVPGLPYHVLGHNDHIAWGFTTTGADVQDLYVETFAGGDSDRYQVPGGTATFGSREEVVKVRSGDDVHLRVRTSRHGPVISDISPELGAAARGGAVALCFVGFAANNPTASALRALNHSRDWKSFRAALRSWQAPVLNVAYADTAGNIGLVVAGVVPIRVRATANLPADGAGGKEDWLGTEQASSRVSLRNPRTHRVVNANDPRVQLGSSLYLSDHFAPEFRLQRIEQLLAGERRLSVGDFLRMQQDVKAGDVESVLPELLRNIDGGDPQALALLRSWDAFMSRDASQPLIYSAWYYQLERTLLGRQLGTAAAAMALETLGSDPARVLRLLALEPQGEQGGLLRDTLAQALERLRVAYGPAESQWRWGDAHPVRFANDVLASLSPAAEVVLQIPMPGGVETLNRQVAISADGAHFPSSQGPGLRAIYDLADLPNSRFIIATGESGDSSTRGFLDLAARWSRGEMIRIGGTEHALFREGDTGIRFTPARAR
jgi:penicillin G amidase